MTDGPAPSRAEQARTWTARVLAVAVLVAAAVLLASWGLGAPLGATAALVLTLADASITPVLWLLAMLGLGAFAMKRLAPTSPLALWLCVGVGIHLVLAHAIGAIGLYDEPVRLLTSWAPVAIGVLMLGLAWHDVRAKVAGPRLGWPMVLAAPGVALLLVACAQPPGALWSSEAHAYDSLSYHLQLPKEWLALGVLKPLEHNAYAFLPSFMEAAYLQLMAMHPGSPLDGTMPTLFSAHILHALLALATALAVGRFIADRTNDALAARWALPLTVSVPWVIVVASLAYNEMAVTLMTAGALMVIFDDKLAPIRRGLLLGFLMGVAVSVKPTAMFTVALPVGLGLLLRVPAAHWPRVFVATGAVGVLVLSTWMARNAFHAGNPVFPYLTSLFGTAHWTPEQAARWASAHTEHAGALERLAMLANERGFGHRQWGIFAPTLALASLACMISARTRRTAITLLVILLAQLLAWLSVGHLQPRFLLPTLPVGVALIALTAHAVPGWIVRIVLALVTLTLSTLSIANYLVERQNNPNWALIPGARVFTEPLGGDLNATTPEAFLRALPAGSRTLLVGDAAALYFPDSITYHTTWDASPLGDALGDAQGDMTGAIARLRENGFTHALVNLDEITRLAAEGWYDPRVTPETAAQLIEAATPVHVWTEGRVYGSHLLSLARPATGSTR